MNILPFLKTTASPLMYTFFNRKMRRGGMLFFITKCEANDLGKALKLTGSATGKEESRGNTSTERLFFHRGSIRTKSVVR